ncbi:hypothetical protein [Mycobacterium pseudoshottsii]|uniref:hypothetical protein n=1 Tax=Mycobacterium pseudoshottsii TaxID=265949 RepID=UPI0026C07ADE
MARTKSTISGSSEAKTFSARNSPITSLVPQSLPTSVDASAPPRTDSPASCSPAAQPSVDSVRAATSLPVSDNPPRLSKNDVASPESKRKAAESISTSSSASRSLLNGSPVRDQLVTMICR